VRTQWTPTDVWTCAATRFQVTTFNMQLISDQTAMIDLWVRAFARIADGLPHVYVTATKDEAEAITGALSTNALKLAAGVVAYWDGAALFESQTIPMTQVTGATPTLTGLTLGCAGTDPLSTWDYLTGYFAAPEVYVLRQIKALLRARNGTGQLLAGYTDAAIERSYGEYTILSSANQVMAAHAEAVPVPSATNLFGLSVNFTVIVGKTLLDAPQNCEDLLLIGGGIRSLLGDEQRTLGGLCVDTVITGVAGPAPAGGAGEHAYQTVRISGTAQFNPLRSDT